MEGKKRNIEKGIEKGKKVQKFGFICLVVFVILYSTLLAVSITLSHSNNKNKFKVAETEYKNVYELKDKSLFILDRQNNEYVFIPVELGDWDYTLNNETELKKIIETYYINKYNTNADYTIDKIEQIFNNIK